MMKVSFKEDCMKVQTFNDRATVVTMVGQMSIPRDFWPLFPNKIDDWIWHNPSVDATWTHTHGLGTIRLEFSGKSVCANGDIFDAETGRRIAESRAKIKLYKFVYNLSKKLMKHYYGLMYGNAEVSISNIKESHIEAPKDCLYITCRKYRDLLIKESHHLGKLLEKA